MLNSEKHGAGADPVPDLLWRLLPEDVSVSALLNDRNRADVSFQAIKDILRKHPRINWDAYLENYPDVKKRRVDPVDHFCEHGIYENRRLFSWHPLREVEREASAPRVSVVITNHNHEIFLDKCLESMAGQTLREIEVIVVDDGSTDNSRAIIEGWAKADSRFKYMFFERNKGTHLARKAAVAAATGDYLMFCDSDDFYRPATCEKAWKAVSKGYDLGQIGLRVINHGALDKDEQAWLENRINKLPEGGYNRNQMLYQLFMEEGVRANLSSKIILRELAQAGFNETNDEYYTDWEDGYELYTIVNRARNLIKIKDRLYMYSYGTGMSYDGASKYEFVTSLGPKHIYETIQEYINQSSLKSYGRCIKSRYIDLFLSLLPKVETARLGEYFRAFARRFGSLEATTELAKRFFDKYSYMASKFSVNCNPKSGAARKTISIVYEDIMSKGGIQTTIQSLCKSLVARGFSVNLILQKRTESDIEIDPQVNIYALGLPVYSQEGVQNHLHAFYRTLQPTDTDLVIYLIPINHWTIWDIILLKFMDIPILHSLRRDHNIDIIMRGKKSLHRDMLNVLRFIDKTFTLSISTELYLRAQGIDAQYIPNPIRNYPKPIPEDKRSNAVLVIARLCDTIKKAKDCLRVLAELKKLVPDANMIFVGHFENQQEKDRFFRLATSLNVEQNIQVTGWTPNPEFYIDQCKVMLSTSYIEGFPNGIAEAQSRGLPVVMYWLDIMMAIDNASVISVDQDDYRQAALEIARLLMDDEERRRLGQIARQKAGEYSQERFAQAMIDLVDNFDRYSPVTYYTPKDYNQAISGMSLFAGNGLPE